MAVEEKNVIGRNLKALRDANNFTQKQVAAFLGIRRSTYANYESGEREAPVEVLEKASELMGCELGVLMDGSGNSLNEMLVCAFRADSLSENDLAEVASFKKIVLNYMKMKRLLSR